MSGDTNQSEILYKSSDMATMLKIQESTLRKYCIMLEEAGYDFHKNEFGHRAFFNKDVMVLKRFIDTKNHPDMTLKQACNAVILWVKENDVTGRDITVVSDEERYNEGYNALLEEFEKFKTQQEEFNKELLEKLMDQQGYIQNSLLERDKKLMQAIRETQETKKIIATVQEKKRWWRFWK